MNHTEGEAEGSGWREEEKTQSDDFVIDDVVISERIRHDVTLCVLCIPIGWDPDSYIQIAQEHILYICLLLMHSTMFAVLFLLLSSLCSQQRTRSSISTLLSPTITWLLCTYRGDDLIYLFINGKQQWNARCIYRGLTGAAICRIFNTVGGGSTSWYLQRPPGVTWLEINRYISNQRVQTAKYYSFQLIYTCTYYADDFWWGRGFMGVNWCTCTDSLFT